MSDSQRSKRIAVLGALVALVVALLVWWAVRDGDSKGDGGDRAAAVDSPGRRAGPLGTVGAAGGNKGVPPLADDGPPPEAPIIDSIELEKKQVCQGEENLVTVVAHTPGHRDDAYLHGVIGGKTGMSVPISTRLKEDGSQPDPRKITIFGRRNEPITVDVPTYTVKECVVDRRAIVAHRLRPNTDAEFDIGVKILEIAATEPFEPVTYHWNFGDGETANTDKPWTIHSYDNRDQSESLYATYLLGVTVTDASGTKVMGRRSLMLSNTAYADLVNSGIVTLSTSLNPRFPVIGDDGKIRQQVRLWHHRPDPVTIEKIQLRTNYNTDREPELRSGSVKAILGQIAIPRLGITVAVELDTNDDPDVFSIDYLLTGVSAEGLPVHGVFPIMRPTKLPTADDNIPVRDPVLKAKIIRARELLDKEYVTDEDIWALERDGVFADLIVPESSGGGQQPTYGDIPAHPPRPGEPGKHERLPAGEQVPVMGRDDAPDESDGEGQAPR